MKALLVALAAVAALPTIAHAEFSAPRKTELRLGTTRQKPARIAPARDSFAVREEPEAQLPRLSVDMVLGKITTAYMAGLERCYRRALVVEPAASGKVTLVFTVDVKGHVLSDLDGLTPTFDRCLTNMIATWRFPHVSEPAEATFKIKLLLTK